MTDRHVPGGRLSAFLDDELDEDDAMLAARHLAACDRCLGELEALRATRDALRRLPSLQAPVLTRGELIGTAGPRRIVRRAGLALATVTVPVVAGVVFYVLGGDPGSVEPTTELFLVEHVGRTGGGPVPAPLGSPR